MRKSAKKQQCRFRRFRKQLAAETLLKLMVVPYKQILERQSLILAEDLVLFLTTGMKKTSVWKTTFAFEHLDTVQPNRPSVLHFLHALPVAVHAKSVKHMVDYLSHVFFLKCTHLH